MGEGHLPLCCPAQGDSSVPVLVWPLDHLWRRLPPGRCVYGLQAEQRPRLCGPASRPQVPDVTERRTSLSRGSAGTGLPLASCSGDGQAERGDTGRSGPRKASSASNKSLPQTRCRQNQGQRISSLASYVLLSQASFWWPKQPVGSRKCSEIFVCTSVPLSDRSVFPHSRPTPRG